jgi:hypothetical protein
VFFGSPFLRYPSCFWVSLARLAEAKLYLTFSGLGERLSVAPDWSTRTWSYGIQGLPLRLQIRGGYLLYNGDGKMLPIVLQR